MLCAAHNLEATYAEELNAQAFVCSHVLKDNRPAGLILRTERTYSKTAGFKANPLTTLIVIFKAAMCLCR